MRTVLLAGFGVVLPCFRAPVLPSAVGDVAQERLDVEDRGAVEGFQVPHLDPGAVDRGDLDAVEAYRVRAVRDRVLKTPS